MFLRRLYGVIKTIGAAGKAGPGKRQVSNPALSCADWIVTQDKLLVEPRTNSYSESFVVHISDDVVLSHGRDLVALYALPFDPQLTVGKKVGIDKNGNLYAGKTPLKGRKGVAE